MNSSVCGVLVHVFHLKTKTLHPAAPLQKQAKIQSLHIGPSERLVDNATASMSPLTPKIQPNNINLAFPKPNVDGPQCQKMLFLKNNWSIQPSCVFRSPATI